MRRTVLPTGREVFLRKRVSGVLAILIITMIITVVTFLILSVLLATTSCPEQCISAVTICTVVVAPVVGSVIAVFFHKKNLLKRGLVHTKKECTSEEVKNILIALLIYFAIILFL